MGETLSGNSALTAFLSGKPQHTLALARHFVDEFKRIGDITIEPTKTMIAVSNGHQRIAWITQAGKDFIHIVFPFRQAHEDNLCFQKVAQVPGSKQFNHHLRIYSTADINEEVKGYMKKAFHGS
jgi:hypothetical protein